MRCEQRRRIAEWVHGRVGKGDLERRSWGIVVVVLAVLLLSLVSGLVVVVESETKAEGEVVLLVEEAVGVEVSGEVFVFAVETTSVRRVGTLAGVTLSIQVKEGRRSTVVGVSSTDNEAECESGRGRLEAESINFYCLCQPLHCG